MKHFSVILRDGAVVADPEASIGGVVDMVAQKLHVTIAEDELRALGMRAAEAADGRASISSFGSAHPQGAQFVFCDGHVQLLSYHINYATYRSLGVRNDGTVSENY